MKREEIRRDLSSIPSAEISASADVAMGKVVAFVAVPHQRLYKMRAAAKYLGIHEQTLRKLTDEGVIAAHLSSVEQKLNTLFDHSHRIDIGLSHLLNPRPEAVNKEEGQPPTPSTVEARLQSILRCLDKLAVDLSDHASRLDSAV